MMSVFSRAVKVQRGFALSALVAISALAFCQDASAVTFNQGATTRIDFAATTGTPPFDFVTLTFNFSGANPFGTNETLSFRTFDANNNALATSATTFASGNGIYTSGLGGSLTLNAFPLDFVSKLTTGSFYALLTATVGSFDLTSIQANFQHILTPGTNQFGVNGTIGAVPLPASLPLFVGGLAGLALLARRRKQKQLAA